MIVVLLMLMGNAILGVTGKVSYLTKLIFIMLKMPRNRTASSFLPMLNALSKAV